LQRPPSAAAEEGNAALVLLAGGVPVPQRPPSAAAEDRNNGKGSFAQVVLQQRPPSAAAEDRNPVHAGIAPLVAGSGRRPRRPRIATARPVQVLVVG